MFKKIILYVSMGSLLLLFFIVNFKKVDAAKEAPDCLYFPLKIKVAEIAEKIKSGDIIISDGDNPLIINARSIIVARSNNGYITHILLSPELGNLCYELIINKK